MRRQHLRQPYQSSIVALTPRDIAQCLADRISTLAPCLLPQGHREGHEWRCGSVVGEPGSSLGVHMTGPKAGVWADFATGLCGDALGLVCKVLGLGVADAMIWSCRWLGLDREAKALEALWERRRGARIVTPVAVTGAKAERKPASDPDPNRWRRPWAEARPIAGTLAERYLTARGLSFADIDREVLRFHPRRVRRSLDDQRFEHHPALLALLRDVVTGTPVGIIDVFLQPDGRDRLRDRKGKKTTGRARGAAVMLSPFEDVTGGLVIGEGVETGIGLLMDGLAPVWALGGAGNLATFPVLDGIECLTIAADADEAGAQTAQKTAQRWRQAGREAVTAAPVTGDWGDVQRAAA